MGLILHRKRDVRIEDGAYPHPNSKQLRSLFLHLNKTGLRYSNQKLQLL